MTEISSIRPHADTQLTPGAPLAPYSQPLTSVPVAFDAPTEDDESSTIKCICGYTDDDGHTVLCEKCNTWQHIACYYNLQEVPDIHECTDCSPRPINAKNATEKQRQIREINNNVGDKKVKKPATKSHKKKTRDSIATVHTNGWPYEKADSHPHDRTSGSPREQPPAKRHKSTHKASPSVPSITNTPSLPPSRRRAGSALVNGQSPSKSPTTPQSHGYPGDYYSSEFLQLYRGEEPAEMTENVYGDLTLPAELRDWLDDPDLLADVTDGMKPTEIFSRLPTAIEEIEATAPHIHKNVREDTDTDINGMHPIWQWLTVEAAVSEGSYVGELRGHLERRKDYMSNPSNRWSTLRHPEPFVFFPPFLPLVIDTRKGGSLMRYVRRSCVPNLVMRIFIDDPHYHFCFVALRNIEAGEELTVRWDLDSDIARYVEAETRNGNVAEKGIQTVEQLSRWVAGALANFGGCACNRQRADCPLERVHCRNGHHTVDSIGRKGIKSKKGKKQQISPISTGHATNSRANSEALTRVDHDDENADTRSVSGSSRSKPTSRDITPMTAQSIMDGNGASNAEPSERETRKLMQINRLFEQQEHDEHHGHRRKKRNSGGSTLQTPSITTSKQLGHSEPSPINKIRKPNMRKRQVIQRLQPRPAYSDSCTQTDAAPVLDPATLPFVRKPFVSPARKLLNRVRQERVQREQQRSASSTSSSPSSPATAALSPSSKSTASPTQDFKSSTTSAASDTLVKDDVEMKDAEVATNSHELTGERNLITVDVPMQESLFESTRTSIQPSPPHINAIPSETPPAQPGSQSPVKPSNLRIDLPPSPDFSSNTTSTTPLTATPGSLAPLATNPASLSPSTNGHPPLFSPSVSNAVAPSPMRKKLSLSDYTSRKAKAQAAATAHKPSDLSASHFDTANSDGAPSTGSPEAARDVEMKDAPSPASPSSVSVTDMGPPKIPASHPRPPLFDNSS